MTQAFLLEQVICRPALGRDIPEIREFCKTIWNGHDYVPDVIDEWLEDRRGLFAVAEYESHTIACSKITWLAQDQWWLEGFRVDPQYQGLKVGSSIHDYVVAWWLEHANGVLRLMTSSKNKSVHHLCKNTGFSRLFEIRGYKAEPLAGSMHGFSSAASRERGLARVVEFARGSASLRITNHLADFGWQCADPTQKGALADLFAESASLKNHFFWWHGGQGLLIVWDDFEADQEARTLGIGVAACELEDLPALLLDVRRLAAKGGRTSVFWLAPAHERIEDALRQAGFISDWEHTAIIFERTGRSG